MWWVIGGLTVGYVCLNTVLYRRWPKPFDHDEVQREADEQ